MTLRCGILTLKTSDSFFRSFRFLRQNEAFSATEQNLTYNNSFFFIVVFLQFSIKVCFSGCLFLITNSKLVISVGKRRGFPRRLWELTREKILHEVGVGKCNFYTIEWESIPFWSQKAENQKFKIEENVMSEPVKMPVRHFLRRDYLHIFFYIKFLLFCYLAPDGN